LASIFSIAHKAVFLDPESKTMLAYGSPQELLESSSNPKVRAFLQREIFTAGGT
jgi:phospholipid/cholesterol/gamma-HCH transport system ATP-binding protein